MARPDELAQLRLEVQALTLAKAALEAQLLQGAEQTDSMLGELMAQRNALRAAHREQRDLGNFVHRVMDTSASLVIVLDTDGRIRMANQRSEAVLGRAATSLVGQVVDALMPAADRDALAESLPPCPWPVLSPLFEHLRRHTPYTAEHRLLGVDGVSRPYLFQAAVLHSPQGKEEGAVINAADIGELRTQEAQLRLAASVFDKSLNAILITTPDQLVVRVNEAFTRITGYADADVLGQTPRKLQSGRHPPAFYAALWANLQRTGQWQGELWNRHRDGHVFPVWQSITAVRDAQGQVSHYIGIFFDISEQKQAAERIHHLAYYDTLTQLPNRQLFHERCALSLARAAREQHRLAVMFLDLDRFKHINDSLGHPVGDALLQAVAQRLRAQVRQHELVARLGGDEFIVVQEAVQALREVEQVARRLVEAFEQPFEVQGRALSIGLSIGIAMYPEDGADVDMLVKHADIALYRAKDRGRGNFQFFEAHLTAMVSERLRIETALRTAIAHGELSVHYQAQHRLSDGALVGAEALLRWTHPELGAVPPDKFIPVAEDSGLIVELGAWVLRTACQQARIWLDQGRPLVRMAVNLSGLQLQRGNLLATVQQVLADTGLPAQRLELEITETYIMRQTERDLGLLAELKALGIALAIDDFGTGQSSLGYLKRLPVDTLKIDRAFVRGLPEASDEAAIISAIVALGHALKRTVLAEGVETAAQAELLRRLGCDMAQGYHFGRPVSAQDFVPPLSGALALERTAVQADNRDKTEAADIAGQASPPVAADRTGVTPAHQG